jgi:hypothetical protein
MTALALFVLAAIGQDDPEDVLYLLEDCKHFHCSATPSAFADAPLLVVGTISSIDTDTGLDNIAPRLWRIAVTETLRGGVGSGTVDVFGEGVDKQCNVGNDVVVAARGYPLGACPPDDTECVVPLLAEVAQLVSVGGMLCKRSDGSMGSPGSLPGPVCFNGQDFRHSEVGDEAASCPATHLATFDDALSAMRTAASVSTSPALALPGVSSEAEGSEQ